MRPRSARFVCPQAVGLLVVCLCLVPVSAQQADPGPDAFGGWSSERVVVKFSPELIAQSRVAARGAAHGRPLDRVSLTPRLQQKLAAWAVNAVRPVYPYEFADPVLAERLGLDRYYVLEVPRGTHAPGLVRQLRRLGWEIETAAVDVVGGLAETIPTDPQFSLQWGMRNTGQSVCGFAGTADADIDATDAWDIHTGDLGTVTIAFLDSGLDPTHPEFAGRILPGFNSIDLDPNLTTDPIGHGTHVAGIAAAAGNDGNGVAGVTWGAYLMPIRVVNAAGVGNASHAAAGLIFAVDNGADVCNMSLQYCTNSETTEDLDLLLAAVQYASAQGVLVVAAAGNSLSACVGNVAFPGIWPEAIAVGATNNRDLKYFSSSTGPAVELAAPGECVWSSHVVSPFYKYLSGTSMATPHVSGLAALIWSYAPYLSDDQVRDLMASTADDIGTPGRDTSFGFGRINAFAALSDVPPPISLIGSDPPDGSIDAGQPFAPDGSNPAGLTVVELLFNGPTAGLGPEDFVLASDPPLASAPRIESALAAGQSVTLTLESPIALEAWTVITHKGSQSSVRIGWLPGDVDGSRMTSVLDITALIDSLNGVIPRPLFSTDIDRTGQANVQDITRLIDLLNGTEAYEPYNHRALPQ